MVFLRVRKFVIACRWKSGPGSCQEARQQTGGSVRKRAGRSPASKAVQGREMMRSLAWREACGVVRGPVFGWEQGAPSPEIMAKAMEAV